MKKGNRKVSGSGKAKYFLSSLILSFMSLSTYSQSLHVVDDAYADSSNPSVILDGEALERKQLLVANLSEAFQELPAGERIAYIKHEFESLPGALDSEGVDKATIRIWVSEVISDGAILVHVINEDWDETSLSFDNRPSISAPFNVINITSADENHWVTIEITDTFKNWVNLQSSFGLALTAAPVPNGPSAVVAFSSKEGVYATVEETPPTSSQLIEKQSMGKSHGHDSNKYRCEKEKKKACYKYRKYLRKAEHYYSKAMKYKQHCDSKRKGKYCKRYHHAKSAYKKYQEKAEKYQKKCEATCDSGCPNDGCPGGGDVNINIVGPTGHPSEIEAVINRREFDLVSRQSTHQANSASQLVSTPLAESALVAIELNNPQAVKVFFMTSYSIRWQQEGVYSLRCEPTITSEDGQNTRLPLLEKTVTKDMRADLVSINGSSLGKNLKGQVSIEVFCELVDGNGNLIPNEASGTIQAWTMP